MKATTRLGAAALALVYIPFSVLAQAVKQPGRIMADSLSAQEPIQISATGEVPQSSYRAVTIANVREHDRASMAWKISIVTMLGASAFDAASSIGKRESNPMLRSSDGTFGGKGVAVKFGLAGASLAPQLLFRSRKDLQKVFTFANFANAGLFAGIGMHNLGMKSVPK